MRWDRIEMVRDDSRSPLKTVKSSGIMVEMCTERKNRDIEHNKYDSRKGFLTEMKTT